MNTSPALTASHVSRIIRAGGVSVRPSGSASSLEGVRVTGSILGEVSVSVDFKIEGIARRRTAAVREILEAAGLTVTPSTTVPSILYVSKELS